MQDIFTNNIKKNKLLEFRQILGDRFDIQAVDIDLPEEQGDPLEIAKQKALVAFKQINQPCLVEDTSLCYNALKGMPGPYMQQIHFIKQSIKSKWFLDAIKPEGLSKLLDGFEDKTAYAQCIISYMSPDLKEPLQFVGKTQYKGKIVRPRGPQNFGWDPCFQPDGFEETYAEMEKSVKNTISHRLRAIDQMVNHFI